jgi:hypothetical protein
MARRKPRGPRLRPVTRCLGARPGWRSLLRITADNIHLVIAVRVGGQTADTDKQLAPVVEALWRNGFDTFTSCQDAGREQRGLGRAVAAHGYLCRVAQRLGVMLRSRSDTLTSVRQVAQRNAGCRTLAAVSV